MGISARSVNKYITGTGSEVWVHLNTLLVHTSHMNSNKECVGHHNILRADAHTSHLNCSRLQLLEVLIHY